MTDPVLSTRAINALLIVTEAAEGTTERARNARVLQAHPRSSGYANRPLSYVDHVGGYCSYYWSGSLVQKAMNAEQYDEACSFLKDYSRALCELDEMRGWTEVDRTHWMDNSVDINEQDAAGYQRRRMAVAPHGDAC